MRDVCLNAILNTTECDQGLTGAQRFELGELAQAVSRGDHDLAAEQFARVRERLGNFSGPLVVNQAWSIMGMVRIRNGWGMPLDIDDRGSGNVIEFKDGFPLD